MGSVPVGTPATASGASAVFIYTVAGVGNLIFCGIANGAGDNNSRQ